MVNNDKEFTAYCGLYCGDCIPFNQQLFDTAEKLKEQLDEVKFEPYAKLKSKTNEVFSDYDVFKKVLAELIKLRCAKNCVNGGRIANCEIKKCVRKKGFQGCWQCDFESCSLLDVLTDCHGDTAKHNLRLIKELGVDNWADKRGEHYIWNNTG